MKTSSSTLPVNSGELFLTDGGIETTLIYKYGFDLPYFAAFHLLGSEEGYAAVLDYYRKFLDIAAEHETGFILESPTWRASADWISKLDYPGDAVSSVNSKAIEMMNNLRKDYEEEISSIVISGCVGPRGDGYNPGRIMSKDEAHDYHYSQVKAMAGAGADLVSAYTLNYAEEAVGFADAAAQAGKDCVISFTVETDGNLPCGMPLKEAIEIVDGSAANKPAYYMINCAHTSHYHGKLKNGIHEEWTKRIAGVRSNASSKSHAELDSATELDAGDPKAFGDDHNSIRKDHSHINVFGGCCGTDERHVREIAKKITSS